MEIIFYNKVVHTGLYEVDIPDDVFFDMIDKTKRNHKYIEKSFRRFQKHDLEFLIFPSVEDKFQVYRKTLESWTPSTKLPLLICNIKRESLNGFSFPWSTRLHDVSSVTRYTFKISHKWSLIFERRRSDVPDQKETNHIWFYNEDQSSTNDWEQVIQPFLVKWGTISETSREICKK